MNDRFKFRVWNKLTHSFTTGGAIKFGGLCFIDEEDLGIKLGEHQELYVIEQCTGLSDKNGKLIYEGDVVQYWWNQKTNTGTIFWNNEFARFCIANNETRCPEDSNCLMFVADKKIIEIISNIHEQVEQKDVK